MRPDLCMIELLLKRRSGRYPGAAPVGRHLCQHEWPCICCPHKLPDAHVEEYSSVACAQDRKRPIHLTQRSLSPLGMMLAAHIVRLTCRNLEITRILLLIEQSVEEPKFKLGNANATYEQRRGRPRLIQIHLEA